jgi:hypothetical protein
MPTWDDVIVLGLRFPEVLAELIEDAWRLRAPKRAIAAYEGK